jgi:hypothetical protein
VPSSTIFDAIGSSTIGGASSSIHARARWKQSITPQRQRRRQVQQRSCRRRFRTCRGGAISRAGSTVSRCRSSPSASAMRARVAGCHRRSASAHGSSERPARDIRPSARPRVGRVGPIDTRSIEPCAGSTSRSPRARTRSPERGRVKGNRLVQLSGGTRTVNRALEAKARALAGLKGYVTNLATCPTTPP